MSLKRADSKDREKALGSLYALIVEVEAEITAAEEREKRMAAATVTRQAQSHEELASKFPALQGGVR